ncbi:MAG: RNA polymerase subunit sigma-70 [Deltaproteobacteria bacterium]|nr:MAG: RNA polymerase subunit sigma-70 [Deltaproteobacteria bacterium]
MTKDTIYMDEEMRGEEDLVSETKIQPMPQKKQAIVPAPQPEDKELVPYDPLQRYLMEIRRYKLLTREEEKELAIRAKKGDKEAAYKLVTSNLRLVVKIALEYHRYWTKSLLDLIQEGNVGLLHAIKKFDPYRGIKFSYYASFWIRAYILKYIMDNWKLVKVGTTQAQRKLFYNLAKEREKLVSQGIIPETRLLAERLDVKEKEVEEMTQRMEGWEISLDVGISDDSRESYGSLLPSPNADIEKRLIDTDRKKILQERLAEFRKTLSGRDMYIFDKRIMSDKPMTLQKIADKYGISKERVRQLEERLLKRLNDFLKERIPNFEEDFSDLAR